MLKDNIFLGSAFKAYFANQDSFAKIYSQSLLYFCKLWGLIHATTKIANQSTQLQLLFRSSGQRGDVCAVDPGQVLPNFSFRVDSSTLERVVRWLFPDDIPRVQGLPCTYRWMDQLPEGSSEQISAVLCRSSFVPLKHNQHSDECQRLFASFSFTVP